MPRCTAPSSHTVLVLGAVVCVTLLAAPVFAQATITGVVKDASGGVLPGVTVEAASAALIEQSRTVVTDSTGQYRIIDLRPGTYTVTFSLTGFNAVKRPGIELVGSATTTVSADLKVGAVEETITVTGEPPIVDVQSTTVQRVLSHEVIDSVPTGRTVHALGVLIPGATAPAAQDVGGSTGGGNGNSLSIHGTRTADMRITQNGVVTATLSANGAASLAVPNVAAAQEVTVDTGAVSAELATGGPRINFIPRDGGNQFRGTAFVAYTNDSLQSSNFTSRVQERGLTTPDRIKALWDVNPGFGGPLKRDQLWFFATVRRNEADNYVGGMFFNANATDISSFAYAADESRPAYNNGAWKDAQARLTWQASTRHKLAFSWDQQDRCACPYNVSASLSPEASYYNRAPNQRLIQAEWTSPVTSRLLLEAVALHVTQGWGYQQPHDLGYPVPGMIPVTDQSTGRTSRAAPFYSQTNGANYWYRGAVSYITGAHAFKVGFNNAHGYRDITTSNTQPLNYRVNTVNGVTTPNQLTLWDIPFSTTDNVNADFGIYAQDRWTVRRLTLTLGVRYDYFKNDFPEQHLGPASLLPNQNLTFPAQDNLRWHDITPRMGAVYDLFGTGNTALKVSLNKYLNGQTVYGLGTTPNPVNALVLSTTRSWTDANRNWVPECDLTSPLGNGECGPLANSAFGQPNTTTFDSDLLTGFGHRFYNWEFSAGVQQRLLPRISTEISYFRRWYGNFQVTDNTFVSAGDYSPFSITAPADSRLPGGGGYVISGLYDLNPGKVGQVQSYNTLSDKYGKQYEHWNGVDVNLNARIAEGTFLQGGISTGRTVTDNCDVLSSLPELAPVGGPYCHQDSTFITQLKLAGSYVVPRVDVQLSGVLQSLPGPAVNANYNAPNAAIAPSLGRNLSGGAANATVNLVSPGALHGERLNQLDLRLGKVLRFGRTRSVVSVDLYNALNTDAILVQNDNYAAWQRAQRILTARFVKFGVQLDF